jgi:alkylation response protein AidB-like acyl-CoA dehydrogenase
VDQGWQVAMYLLQFERGMYAWQRQAWLLARVRALRADFALTMAGPESVGLLGDAYLSVLALRARTAETVRALAREEDVGPGASVDKVLLAHAEQTVLDAARALLAPTFEVDRGELAEQWRADWFYTRAASVYGGAGEIQRSILADRVLELPREPR